MPESYIALAKTLFNHTLRYMLKIYVIGIYKTMSKEAQCFSRRQQDGISRWNSLQMTSTIFSEKSLQTVVRESI